MIIWSSVALLVLGGVALFYRLRRKPEPPVTPGLSNPKCADPGPNGGHIIKPHPDGGWGCRRPGCRERWQE